MDQTHRDPDRRLLWAFLLAGAGLSLLVCFNIVQQKFFVGSDDGGWVYPYFWSFSPSILGIWAIACAAVFALLALPESFISRHPCLTLAGWLVLAIALQALLRSLTHFTFAQMFTSDAANSFYSPTRHHGTIELMTGFTKLRATLPLHAQSNMPGKLIFVSLLGHLSNRPQTMAWTVVMFSAAGALLLYLFVRDFLDDRRVALYSAILYMFVPGKLYFFPLLNTLTPVLAIAALYVLNRWLTSGRYVYGMLLGMILYAIVFFEPLPLALGLLFSVLLLRAWATRRITGAAVGRGMLAGLMAFAAVYMAFIALARFDLFATLRSVLVDAAAFNATVHRPYGIWLRANLLEFAFGAGIVQSVVFCGVLSALALGSLSALRSWITPIAALSLGLGGVLAAIDLLGVNRGEVTRLWIFLACLFQIPTAYGCARLGGRMAIGLVLALTLLQCALGTAMIAFVLP